MLMSCRKIVTSLSFFGFLANLEQSGGRIPDTESAKVMFSVIVTFYLTKTENRTKKSRTQLSHYWFENSTQIRRDINPIFRRDKISPFGQ